MSKGWYQRQNDFTPYTKADGQAVSDEFDSIQASFERIPEMRDDGKGFKVSPVIPKPTLPNHPVPLSMLTETEKSVNNAKDLVLEKAKQVEKNTATVASNTVSAEAAKNTANVAADTATQKAKSATESETMAKKWASHTLNQVVQGSYFSAYHYAVKAKESEGIAKSSATTAVEAKNSAMTSATTATTKANEAEKSAIQAREAAFGRNEWKDIKNVPRASTITQGITQLTNALDFDVENLSLTARAGKRLKDLFDGLKSNLSNYIPNSKKSNAIDSTSSDNVATSWAAKKAYDKAAEAEELANSKYTAQNASTTQRGLTQHYSGYDSDREDLSASAKVIKLLKGFVDSNTRRFDNHIPNSKKSSVTDSNSADTVATSAAVKKAYDLAAAKQSPQTTLRGYGITDAVQIGGGADQTRNKIFMGWSTELRLKVQVDSTNLGNLVFDNHLFAAISTFAKRGSFKRSSYPNYYNGAEVFTNDISRLKITVLHKTLNKTGYSDLEDYFLVTLPEPYTGFSIAIVNAFSRYSGSGSVFALPAAVEVIDNGTKVKVHCSADTYGAALNVIVIGAY